MRNCLINKRFLNIFLLICLVGILVLPKISLADDFENINSEELSKYLELPEKDANKLMDTLRQVFTTKSILAWSSGEVSDEETSVAVTLQKVVTMQALSHLLVDAPLEITQKIIKAATDIVQIYINPAVFWEKFEKLTVEKAIEEGKRQLFQNEIRVTPGAIKFKYYSYKGGEKEIILQYVMIYKPERNEKRADVVIRFYMPNSIEAPAPLKHGSMTSLDVPDLKKDLPPFIVEIRGIVEKDEFNNYLWINEIGEISHPSVNITFPDNVPDLGIKPLSPWEKYVLKPIETQIKDIDIIITKVTGKSLNLVGIWDKIKSFFSKINPPAPAALIETPLPEEEESSVEVGQEIGQEIFPSVEVPSVEVKPQQPQQPQEKKQLTLEELQEMLDDIAERIDILSQGVAELVAKSQSISEEIEEPEEELKEEEEKLEKVPEQRLCEKVSWSYPLRNKIIINEVAWMGTTNSANDEWIELKNISGAEINLAGWQLLDKDNQIKISFNIQLRVLNNGVLLLERTNDETVPQISADLIYTGGLSNTNEALYLFDENCQLQDEVLANPNWPAGDNTSKRTTERKNNFEWQTSLNPGGTPKRENSSGYVEIISGGGGGTPALPPPILKVSTTPLNFEAINDVKAPASQSLIIQNSGGSNLNWKVSSLANWLNFNPSEGSISAHSSSTIEVSVNINGMATGSTSTTFRVEAAENNPQTISVNLIIYEKKFAQNVVISEVQIAGEKTSHDFIELFNPTDSDIYLGNYNGGYLKLVKRTQSGTENINIKSWRNDSASRISHFGYYLWASSEDENYPSSIIANSSTTQTISENNGVALVLIKDDNESIIDAVGWGDFSNVLYETSAFPQNPSKGKSLGRKMALDNGKPNYLDLDNNRLDFDIQTPTPGERNENLVPIAKFDFSPKNPYVGDNILFNASGSQDDGNIVSYIWDFGDGSSTSTASSQITKFFSTSSNFIVSLSVVDDLGATSTVTSTQIFVKSREPLSVVINEISWMGTKASSSDEWIEFYNNTTSSIDIINWSIAGAKTGECLNFSNGDGFSTTTILSKNFLIYADHQESITNSTDQIIVDIWDDEIEMSDDLPGQLTLYDVPNCQGGDLIDVVGEVNGEWFAGNATDSISMERISATTTGATSTNWANNNLITRNGKDADGNPIYGTPKSENSVSKSQTEITQENLSELFGEFSEITLTYLGSPYIIQNPLIIPQEKTLNVEPGVTLKFKIPEIYGPGDGAYLRVQGNLKAIGQKGKEILFTSTGDLWPGIVFENDTVETNINSQLEYVKVEKARSWELGIYSAIKVDQKAISIKNSVFEDSGNYRGLYLINSPSIVENTTFKNFISSDPRGLYPGMYPSAIFIENGAPIIKNSDFSNNYYGIIIQTTSTCFSNPDFKISGNIFTQNYIPIYLTHYGFPCFEKNQVNSPQKDNLGNVFDGVLVGRAIISQDTLWQTDLPLIIENDITVSNAILTISSATVVKFKYTSDPYAKGYLAIESGGKLVAQGEEGKLIHFTSASENPAAGDWRAIWFKEGTSGELNSVRIKYGGFGLEVFRNECLVIDPASTTNVVLTDIQKEYCNPYSP